MGKVYLPVGLLAVGLSGCAAGLESQLVEMTSEEGAVAGVFSPSPDPPRIGTNELTIELTGTDGMPLTGAAIDVVPWMPAHGHGSPRDPETIEVAPGAYLASDLYYPMAGHWELRITVEEQGLLRRFVVPQEVR